MSLHIRGPHGATLLRKDYGPVTAYNTKTDRTLGLCVYPYWHPSGRYIAYSTNTTNQLFHSAGKNRVEVFDTASDLQVYDVEKNELLLSPLLKQDSGRTPCMRPIPSSPPMAARCIFVLRQVLRQAQEPY